MINSFLVGDVVTGNSFIGRKELVQQYRKQFLTKAKSSSVSIIGITRIGKTSFVNKVFDKIPDSIIYSFSNLKESSTYQELWQSIFSPIQEYLEKHNLLNRELLDDFSLLENEDLPWIKLRSVVKRIFLFLGEKQLKSIIVLDEFDYATVLFNSETKKYELFRSVISNPDYNLAAILISRRNLHDIEGQTFQSSTFRGVFDTRYFKGFNDDDLEEYYKVFENKNINLSSEQKKEIQYYAGNSPYLLSIIGNRILDRRRNNKEINIAEIFRNDCCQINDYYADILKHMERDNTKDKLISFVLGPNIGITRADIDELTNLGYVRNVDNEFIPISKCFEDYLRNHKLNESIWEQITTTERKIKVLIETEKNNLKKAYGITINDRLGLEKEILDKTPGISSDDVARCKTFIKSNKRDWNVESSYFDVMSLKDSFKIISSQWNIFSKYFNNELLSNWKPIFELIGIARNAPAHVHEEYLSDTIKRDVDIYCSDIQKYISKVFEMPYSTANAEESTTVSNLSQQNLNTEINTVQKTTNSSSQVSGTNVFTGKILEEKTDIRGNKYFKIERENQYAINAFSNNNSIEYYNHSVGDTVTYRIQKNNKDGKTFECAIILASD